MSQFAPLYPNLSRLHPSHPGEHNGYKPVVVPTVRVKDGNLKCKSCQVPIKSHAAFSHAFQGRTATGQLYYGVHDWFSPHDIDIRRSKA